MITNGRVTHIQRHNRSKWTSTVLTGHLLWLYCIHCVTSITFFECSQNVSARFVQKLLSWEFHMLETCAKLSLSCMVFAILMIHLLPLIIHAGGWWNNSLDLSWSEATEPCICGEIPQIYCCAYFALTVYLEPCICSQWLLVWNQVLPFSATHQMFMV